ncbi:MAG: hypothetical protein ACKVHP_03725, partial [Verrucomicrobiales bacterium]
LVGRVIRQVKGDLFDSALVDPQVDFSKLDLVFVIRIVEDKGEEVEVLARTESTTQDGGSTN